MSKRSFDNAFYTCPGAWFGNQVYDNKFVMVVDPTKLVPALAHLKKHRMKVTETSISTHTDPGIALVGDC